MVTVEKVRGGRVRVRGIGRFGHGDRAEVSESEAAYLCEGRGDFERVDELESATVDPDDAVDTLEGAADGAENDRPGGHLTRFDPGDLTVGDIQEKLADFDYEAWELKHLVEEEREGKSRSTAVEAITDRLDDLED